MKIQILDLQFLNHQKTVGAFVVKTSEGPVLIETGPHSVRKNLEAELARLQFRPEELRAVLLTHIHFDHAGGAWACADAGTDIYVHPVGAPHLADPQKLTESARRIYKDDMDRLWGEIRPIVTERLHTVADREILRFGDTEFLALHTPGHASHHISWQIGDSILSGDAAGVQIDNGPVVPPCPPPDIDVETWSETLNIFREIKPKSLILTHFGEKTNVSEHLDELETTLYAYADFIRKAWEAGTEIPEITRQFDRFAAAELRKKGLNETETARYQAANPAWMSVAGLLRYWKKKAH